MRNNFQINLLFRGFLTAQWKKNKNKHIKGAEQGAVYWQSILGSQQHFHVFSASPLLLSSILCSFVASWNQFTPLEINYLKLNDFLFLSWKSQRKSSQSFINSKKRKRRNVHQTRERNARAKETDWERSRPLAPKISFPLNPLDLNKIRLKTKLFI